MGTLPPSPFNFIDSYFWALQLVLAKPSDNVVEFSLRAVKPCKDATQDDAQKVLCVETLLKNADQLFMDQKKWRCADSVVYERGTCLCANTYPAATLSRFPTYWHILSYHLNLNFSDHNRARRNKLRNPLHIFNNSFLDHRRIFQNRHDIGSDRIAGQFVL